MDRKNVTDHSSGNMKIVRNIDDVVVDPLSIVTIGTFDGVHLGHQAILRYAVKQAKAISGISRMITFHPHPRDVVGKGPVEHLCTIEERLHLFESQGIDETLVVNFTHAFSQITARSFYEQYIVRRIGVYEVVIGHDHQFGRNREGSIETLQKLGAELNFSVVVIPGVSVDGQVVSSSLIRRCLLAGEIEDATKYLGKPYSITAKVVEGDKRGRSIGFPTANLYYDSTLKLTPASGVYVASVVVDGKQYYGMVNIGVRPTFTTNGHRLVEVHILDFEGDLYGKTITVAFIKRLRREQKFNSVDDLVAQLQHDRLDSRKIVSSIIH